MTDRSILDRVADVDLVEQVIDRVAETGEEAAALRRVLGVQGEADRLAEAYAPEAPLPPVFRPQVDHVAHARATLVRYQAWVDSFPDGDDTPLAVRERTLRLAQRTLARLEAGAE